MLSATESFCLFSSLPRGLETVDDIRTNSMAGILCMPSRGLPLLMVKHDLCGRNACGQRWQRPAGFTPNHIYCNAGFFRHVAQYDNIEKVTVCWALSIMPTSASSKLTLHRESTPLGAWWLHLTRHPYSGLCTVSSSFN